MRNRLLFGALLFTGKLFAATSATVAVDSAGNVWRTGSNDSFIATTPDAFQKTATFQVCATEQLTPFDPPRAVNCPHAFLTREDANGKVLYATYLAGGLADGGTAVAIDPQGNVYVTGYTYSSDFPVSAGAAQPKNAGPLKVATVFESLGPFGPVAVVAGGDAFVAKFASDGKLLYSTLLGGSGTEAPSAIVADSNGAAYVIGTTASTDFPGAGSTAGGYFLARVNAQGTAVTYAMLSRAAIHAVAVSDAGIAYVTGLSADTSGAYVTAIDTGNKNVRYSVPVPGGSGAVVAVSGAGEAWVGTSPPAFPPALIPQDPVYPDGPAHLLRLAADGSRVVTDIAIGTGYFDALRMDSAGNVYAFGHSKGALPPAPVTLLSLPCSDDGGFFVLEAGAPGSVPASTYLRQGDDRVPWVSSPGHVVLYRSSAAPLAVDLTSAPPMTFECPVNLGSGAVLSGIAAGEVFAIFGNGIGPSTGVVGAPDASGQYPTTLGGTQVLISGAPAPLVFAQAGEIHGVIPGPVLNSATVEVRYNGANAPPLDTPEVNANPGILTLGGQAAAIHLDGTVNSPTNPAKLGSIVSLYTTGIEYFRDALRDGQVTPIPPPLLTFPVPVQVKFGGVEGTVLWAGWAPGIIAGVEQINVQLPAALPAGTSLSAVPVVATILDVDSPPATMSVAR